MLKLKNLTTVFKEGAESTTAANQVSFEVPEKSVVGLVGESGSGKSVTALSILNLLPPNGEILKGEILWNGKDLTTTSERDMQKIRGAEIGLIFQNPLASLNPVFTVGNQLIETIILHQQVDKSTARSIAVDLLRKVSIPDPEERLENYPHEFSLGMCQRIMIAITLAMKPKLLIADEPTASLDVTIQAQILALMQSLKEELGLSILLISHDLGVIAQECDIIQVMYLGKIVESGPPEILFKTPKHPYTKALISAIPNPDPTIKNKAPLLKGEVPSPKHLPKGCAFHTRCPQAMPRCQESIPSIKTHDKQSVACFLYD